MPGHGADQLTFWAELDEDLRPRCFVYVIQPEDDSPIKVGRAVDVPKRLSGLQTGNPRKLQLLHVMPGGAELEWQLHYRLRDSRLLGEWFDGDQVPPFLDFVAGLAEFFVSGQLESGYVPDFRQYRDGWALRRYGKSPARVTFIDPDPTWVEEMEARRRKESECHEFTASERQKLEFARAHSHPTFTPHRPR